MESPMERSPNDFRPVAPEYFTVKLIGWALNTALYLLVALAPLVLRLFGVQTPLWLVIAPPLAVLLNESRSIGGATPGVDAVAADRSGETEQGAGHGATSGVTSGHSTQAPNTVR